MFDQPITSEHIEAAQQCLRRSAALLQHMTAVELTAQEKIQLFEGRRFEAIVEYALRKEGQFKLVAAAINHSAANYGLPHDPLGSHIEYKGRPPIQEFDADVLATQAEIINVEPNKPKVILQAALKNNSQPKKTGRPDILVWTGTRWVIIDIKSAEDAATEHAIQLNHYQELLKETFKSIKATHPGFNHTEILPDGFILHATPAELEADGKSFVVHTVPLNSGQGIYQNTVQRLTEAQATDIFANKLPLIQACSSCEFRNLCHKNCAVENHKSIDRLQLTPAAKEWLFQQSISTIPTLKEILTKEPNSVVTRFLTKGVEQIRYYLLEQIAQHEAGKTPFNYRPLQTWKENYLVYASALDTKRGVDQAKLRMSGREHKILQNGKTCSSDLVYHLNVEAKDKPPAVIVCFDANDKLRAQIAVRRTRTDFKKPKIRVVSLQEILRSQLPVPTIADTPAGYLQLLQNGLDGIGQQFDTWAAQTGTDLNKEKEKAEFLKHYVESIDQLWKRLWTIWESQAIA